MPVPPNAFQLRTESGYYNVYWIKVNGRDVPRDKQRVIWSGRFLTKVQPIADALNNGLLDHLLRQLAQQRTVREATGQLG
jgi:hypothetical protein